MTTGGQGEDVSQFRGAQWKGEITVASEQPLRPLGHQRRHYLEKTRRSVPLTSEGTDAKTQIFLSRGRGRGNVVM